VSAGLLSPSTAALILFGGLFLLLVLRVPVAFALGLACLPMMLFEERLSMQNLVQETFNAYNSFILLAVPFFLLTANLMNIGGITDRLVRLSRTMVGHFPGALAQINVLLSVFFAGISGSSTADAASQSKIFIEAQVKEVMDGLGETLKAAGMDFSNVVEGKVYLADIEDYAKMNEVYRSYFKSDPPSRTCISVQKLVRDSKVEITLVATTK
jgi:enamine deaminase RidA (YjgF/YER057c/UK114 family)